MVAIKNFTTILAMGFVFMASAMAGRAEVQVTGMDPELGESELFGVGMYCVKPLRDSSTVNLLSALFPLLLSSGVFSACYWRSNSAN